MLGAPCRSGLGIDGFNEPLTEDFEAGTMFGDLFRVDHCQQLAGVLDLAVLALLFSASSAKSVGSLSLRFGQSSKRMIQRNFDAIVRAKSVRSSGHHSDFVVEAFHSGAGQLPFGAEPVHQ
jgi:hypothetical protein